MHSVKEKKKLNKSLQIKKAVGVIHSPIYFGLRSIQFCTSTNLNQIKCKRTKTIASKFSGVIRKTWIARTVSKAPLEEGYV